MTHAYRPLVAISLAFLSLAFTADAQRRNRGQDQEQDQAADAKPVSCVLSSRIDRTVGANDKTVVFFMRGGVIYRNDLLQSCPALTPGETRLVFNYATQSAKINRLCGDSFSVERRPGLECLLGKFNPITAEEAGTLLGTSAAAAPAGN